MVIAQIATANRIIGNYVGTDVSGTKAIGNTSAGIYLGALGNGNTISGNTITLTELQTSTPAPDAFTPYAKPTPIPS